MRKGRVIMAQFNVDFPDDIMSGLLDTEFSEIAEAALAEAGPILENTMKASAKATIMHEGDSEMVNSIKMSKPKATRTNAWITNVGPSGNSSTKKYTAVDSKGKRTHRKHPVSNALKAIWKEYGIPGRQPPRPFIQSAVNLAQSAVIRKMQEVYNRKVGAK